MVEHLDGAHHLIESGSTSFRQAEGVVNIGRTVERDTKQEIVCNKQLAPRLINQGAIGLQRVFDAFTVGIFLLQQHCFSVKIDPQQQRLTAVPVELHDIYVIGLDVLADVTFEQLVAHHHLVAAILLRLIQVVTIVTIEIAA